MPRCVKARQRVEREPAGGGCGGVFQRAGARQTVHGHPGQADGAGARLRAREEAEGTFRDAAFLAGRRAAL